MPEDVFAVCERRPASMPGQRFVRSAADVVLTFTVVTLLSFLLMRPSPIDPAEAFAIRNSLQPSDERISELREAMGLDGPLIKQYAAWLRNAVCLDFGRSLVNNKPVLSEFAATVPYTLRIVALSTAMQALGAILLGCLGYRYRGKGIGSAVRFVTVAGVSVPSFYLATAYLDTIAVKLQWIAVASGQGLLRDWHPRYAWPSRWPPSTEGCSPAFSLKRWKRTMPSTLVARDWARTTLCCDAGFLMLCSRCCRTLCRASASRSRGRRLSSRFFQFRESATSS